MNIFRIIKIKLNRHNNFDNIESDVLAFYHIVLVYRIHHHIHFHKSFEVIIHGNAHFSLFKTGNKFHSLKQF